MDNPYALPRLDQIFRRLARGGHITAENSEWYGPLREYERRFTELFEQLGFRLIADSRGFYYFEGQIDQTLSPQVRKLAVFVYILVETLGEEAESVEDAFFEREWQLENLPHLQRDRYLGYLKQLEVELNEDGLANIVAALERYGFARRLDGGRFRFLAPAYRFLDHCLQVAESVDAAVAESVTEEAEQSA